MRASFKRVAIGSFFLFSSLFTSLVGGYLSGEFLIFAYLPLNLQYDLSFPGLLSFLWLITLICGCTLLTFAGVKIVFGTNGKLWPLLAVTATAGLFAARAGWPSSIVLLALVVLVAELSLLAFSRQDTWKVCAMAGILLGPYCLYLQAFNVEQIYIIKGAGLGEFVRLGIGLLPVACVWLAVRLRDALHPAGHAGEEKDRQKAGSVFGRRILLQTDVIAVMMLLIFAIIAWTDSRVEEYKRNFELHAANYGHVPPDGLHADLVETKGSIGIPGITKLYEAHLFNFSYFPRIVQRCDSLDDTLSYGAELAYSIQRWNESRQEWIILEETAGGFHCGPAPLSKIHAKRITALLMPGHSLSTTWEATGARDSFELGDKGRFVVFTRLDGSPDSISYAFPTREFLIDEEVEDNETQYKLAH